jgi:magnesium transporter
MTTKKIITQMIENLEAVLNDELTTTELWQSFIKLHPADIADFCETISHEQAKSLFKRFDDTLKLAVFQNLSDALKVFCLSFLDDHDRALILQGTPLDRLTDLFDTLSDEALKHYLRLLHTKDRQTILSLLQFSPESAGRITETDVLTLMEDFTVEKSIRVLQRLQPDQHLHRRIFVTNQNNQLVGFINLEDLVLKQPSARIASFMRPNSYVINAQQDQEEVAHQMVHYGLMTGPVVDDYNNFLGVISSDTLIDVIEDEASEDVYKMSAMAPIKETYFDTPFFRLFYERSSILIILLIAQTLSSLIIQKYQATINGFLMLFLTMLISAGGNASSQTSAIVIQGLASGEINPANMFRFLRREFLMACIIGITLGCFSLIRIVVTHGVDKIWGGIAVSSSLSLIVLVSIVLGSCIPLGLKKLRLDPAFSAGPGLATLMDILGLLIYCFISHLILGF